MYKKKKSLLVLISAILLISKSLFAQTDSINYYITKLNWNSFKEGIGYVPSLSTMPEIDYLIKTKTSNKINLLLKNLSNPMKTVALHIILTKICDSTYNRFGIESKGESTIAFFYNDLEWRTTPNTKEIDKKAIKDVIKYWNKNRDCLK